VHPRRVVVLDEGKAIDVPHGLGLASTGDVVTAASFTSSAMPDARSDFLDPSLTWNETMPDVQWAS